MDRRQFFVNYCTQSISLLAFLNSVLKGAYDGVIRLTNYYILYYSYIMSVSTHKHFLLQLIS